MAPQLPHSKSGILNPQPDDQKHKPQGYHSPGKQEQHFIAHAKRTWPDLFAFFQFLATP